MEINFQGQFDRDLFYHAMELATRPQRREQIFRNVALGIFILVFLYGAFVFLTTPKSIYTLIPPAMSLLGILYFVLIPGMLSRRTTNTFWKQESIQSPLSGRADSETITFLYQSVGESTFKWESIARIRREPDLVVLITKNGILSIYPRRFFASEQDWSQFNQWVDARQAQIK